MSVALLDGCRLRPDAAKAKQNIEENIGVLSGGANTNNKIESILDVSEGRGSLRAGQTLENLTRRVTPSALSPEQIGLFPSTLNSGGFCSTLVGLYRLTERFAGKTLPPSDESLEQPTVTVTNTTDRNNPYIKSDINKMNFTPGIMEKDRQATALNDFLRDTVNVLADRNATTVNAGRGLANLQTTLDSGIKAALEELVQGTTTNSRKYDYNIAEWAENSVTSFQGLIAKLQLALNKKDSNTVRETCEALIDGVADFRATAASLSYAR